MIQKLKQYIHNARFISIGLVFLQFTLWIDMPIPLGIILSIISVICIGSVLGRCILPKTHVSWQILIGSVGFLAALMIVLSGMYWFWYMNQFLLSLGILFVTIPIYILPKKQSSKIIIKFNPNRYWIIASMVLIGDILLLSTLLSRRLGDTLISPWTLVGTKFFLIFFLTTTLLLFTLKQKINHGIQAVLTTLHYILFLCVAFIVYKHGFGFDPFIHQASEQWILDNGVITPKTPYYIGQYMLVLFGYFTTGLPLTIIDHALVPLGAALLLPTFAVLTQKKQCWLSVTLLVFLPLTFFIVTTPHTLALLLAALTVFWIRYEHTHKKTIGTRTFGWLLVGGACVTHALIGIPLAIIYGSSHIFSAKKTRMWLPLYGTLLAVAVPVVFFVALRGNLTLTHPIASLDIFLNLFKKPHWFVGEPPSLFWKILYAYKQFIVPIALGGIGIGMYLSRKDTIYTIWNMVTIGAVSTSAFLMATTIWPTNLISYERGNYAKRLLELTLVLMLPYLLVTAEASMQKIRTLPKQILFALVGAGLLTISWYFTYPTRDPVSLYTGYAVRDADIEAVRFIDKRNNGEQNYIVLTNQMTGVAALGEFGFSRYHTMIDGSEQYFYSIPTGAPLYQYFRKMVYEEPKRLWMEEAMNYAGVDKAYFVHTNTWAPAATIRDAAKKEADNWWELSDGRVWVYEYKK